MNHISKNLTYLRKTFRVTQTQLATLLGKSQSTIGGWESKVSEPAIDILDQISEYFDIPIDYLIRRNLERENLITPERVAEWKKKKDPKGKLPSIKNNVQGYEKELAELRSMVEEDDSTRSWALLTLMRQIDEKLDRLLRMMKKENIKKT